MKYIIRIALFIIVVYHKPVLGQQLPQYTQFMYNRLVINPAVTGTQDYVQLSLNHRAQWGGFEGAPRSQNLSVHSRIKDQNHGIGGYFYNDKFGPLRNTGINASYAYHLRSGNDNLVSLGLSASLRQFSVNGNEILLNDETDELIDLTTISSSMVPEFGFGAMYTGKQYYFGVSVLQLLGSEAKVFKNINSGTSMTDVQHLYIIGSYTIEVDEDIRFIPSVMLQSAINNPTQVDINARFSLRIFEFGATYRTDDALAFLANISVTDFIDFGYSYDIQTSTLAAYSSGTHELMLRYKMFYDEAKKKAYIQRKSEK